MVTTTSYPDPATPATVVEWAFTNAWNIAESKSTTSDNMFSAALDAAGTTAPSMTPAAYSFTPDVVEPLVDIPTTAQGASIATFYELSNVVIELLAGLFGKYMDTYFPDETPYLQDAESWLVKALTVGGTGIRANIEDQMWQRDRARILKDSMRAEDEVYSTWAARRFPLPPGAAANAILTIRRDAASKIADSSQQLAIKQMEIEIENIKFAVENSIKLYSAAMTAAVDYVKALSIGPANGMQLIPSITDSQSRLISAAADYYRSRISVEELKMKAAQIPTDYVQQSRAKNADLLMQLIDERVKAAIAAAQAMSTQAASALNSLHAAAQISGSSNNSVGYSYSNDTTDTVPPITSV